MATNSHDAAPRPGDAQPIPDRWDLLREVEQFLYHEARLLDERRFHEWLDLFTEDTHYWMPTRFNRLGTGREDSWEVEKELAGLDEMAFFDDNKVSLQQRVARLDTGMAWAEEPRSRTRHLVTNVQVEPADVENEFKAFSNFIVYRSRLETEEDYFVGARQDVLRRIDGELKIASRKIIYDRVVSRAKNLSMLF